MADGEFPRSTKNRGPVPMSECMFFLYPPRLAKGFWTPTVYGGKHLFPASQNGIFPGKAVRIRTNFIQVVTSSRRRRRGSGDLKTIFQAREYEKREKPSTGKEVCFTLQFHANLFILCSLFSGIVWQLAEAISARKDLSNFHTLVSFSPRKNLLTSHADIILLLEVFPFCGREILDGRQNFFPPYLARNSTFIFSFSLCFSFAFGHPKDKFLVLLPFALFSLRS